MAKSQELEVQEKQQVEKDQESTVPARVFVPPTDIFEGENELTIVMEMPGVSKDNVSVDLENDNLRIQGKIDFSNYEAMQPVYTEYNIGHYQRGFTLSNKINREKISADLTDGVLTIILPKAEEVKARTIKVN